MAEVLTQSQIDALLNSMMSDDAPSGEQQNKEPEQNWKKYDFTSPKKFTKDKLKLLKGIYDNYSRLAASRMNGILRTACEVEVLSVEEQRYFEFSNLLNENDVMMMLNLKLPDESKNPPMMVHISQKLMANMIDRMLGGTGDDEVDASYTYTDIENALYKQMMKYLLGLTKDAWSNYIKIALGDQRMEENPELFQEISLDEPVAIVLLNIRMQNIDGTMTICIPGNLLMNIFNIIDKRKHMEGVYDEGIANSRELIMTKLKTSTMEIKAELGDASLSLRDVCNLKPGDVIDLNKPKESEITLYVEEQPWFKGRLGAYNKNAAIKIKRRLLEEEPAE